MDFNDPDVDLQKIAEGLGARTDKISNQKAVGDALTRAFAHTGPTFLVIDREP
jgi:benzoylformate decarboxylase